MVGEREPYTRAMEGSNVGDAVGLKVGSIVGAGDGTDVWFSGAKVGASVGTITTLLGMSRGGSTVGAAVVAVGVLVSPISVGDGVPKVGNGVG